MKASKSEALFDFQCKSIGLPSMDAEYRFDAKRRWRFDRVWIEKKIAIEIEGGTWINGRHNRGSGYEADCEKYNAAVMQGWKVFRFTSSMVKTGIAVNIAEEAYNSFTS